jgi:glycosyltransferase involved in cell wall biosynthesis
VINSFSSKVLIITNIPSPYRVLQFNKLATILDSDLLVVYFQETEPNRYWDIPQIKHRYFVLKKTIFSRINFYPDIFKKLVTENPGIIIASGFTLTILFTFIYTWITRKRFVVFTDAWLHPVNNMKFYHRLVRRLIIPRADASICVGKKGKEFLLKYGAAKYSIFISPLSIRNDFYSSFCRQFSGKEYDIIFSGQFIDRKMPLFVIDVLQELRKTNSNIKLLLIGSGPLEHELIIELEKSNIKYSYPGFIAQEELPGCYANSKLLLFPTKEDSWGIVANEACAVGTPVITCENAGVADDLVIHNFNGYVLPLSVEIWVEHISKLLSDPVLYNTFSRNSLEHIKLYSVENAANGIKDAINYLLNIGSN